MEGERVTVARVGWAVPIASGAPFMGLSWYPLELGAFDAF